MSGAATPSAAPARAPSRLPWIALILVLAIALPLIPFYFKVSDYVLNIFMNSVTYAMAVLGMVVVLGYAGQINLAQAAFFGFGAYAVGLGTVTYGLPFWVSFAIGMVLAGAAGLMLGLTTLRLGGHYLAMITISFQMIFDLVVVNWVEMTHGPGRHSGRAPPSFFGHALNDQARLSAVRHAGVCTC